MEKDIQQVIERVEFIKNITANDDNEVVQAISKQLSNEIEGGGLKYSHKVLCEPKESLHKFALHAACLRLSAIKALVSALGSCDILSENDVEFIKDTCDEIIESE